MENKMKESELFNNMHIQWFADVDPEAPEMQFEDEEQEEEDFEFVDLKPGENLEDMDTSDLPDEYQGISKAELYRRLSGKDDSEQREVMRLLKETIEENRRADQERAYQSQLAQQAQYNQRPQESDEEFEKRIQDEMYSNPTKALQEWAVRNLGPAFAQIQQSNMQTAYQLAQNDPQNGWVLKKYGGEVQQVLQSWGQGNNPQMLGQAINAVKMHHFDEVLEEKVKEELEKRKTPRREPQHSERAARAGTSNPKRKVGVTPSDRAKALEYGLDIDTYMRMKRSR